MTAPAMSSCVVCGGPHPLGLGVCSRCGGTAHAAGDTLIFVKPAPGRADCSVVRAALDPLLDGHVHRAGRGLVASGHRALAQVPAAAADSVLRHLAVRGVPAVARRAGTAWAPTPVSFSVLLVAMVVVGWWAGLAAVPMLRWTSPVVALLLLMAAQLRLRRPAIEAPARRAVFPRRIEKLIAKTFAQLPDGDARDYLARLVRAAEPVHRALRRNPAGATAKDVTTLLAHACQAAVDLSDLNMGLVGLDGQPGALRAARLRTGLSQRFLQGINLLHRIRADTVDHDPARHEVASLLDAWESESTAYALAQREMATLLEGRPGS